MVITSTVPSNPLAFSGNEQVDETENRLTKYEQTSVKRDYSFTDALVFAIQMQEKLNTKFVRMNHPLTYNATKRPFKGN